MILKDWRIAMIRNKNINFQVNQDCNQDYQDQQSSNQVNQSNQGSDNEI